MAQEGRLLEHSEVSAWWWNGRERWAGADWQVGVPLRRDVRRLLLLVAGS